MQTSVFKRVILMLAIAGVACWVWYASRSDSSGMAAPATQSRPAAEAPIAGTPAGAVPPAGETPPLIAQAPAVAPMPPAVSPAGPDKPVASAVALVAAPPGGHTDMEVAWRDIRHLQFMIRDFRLALGGNPVGSNAEIMKALLGRNPKKLVLPLLEGQQLNGEGELVDPWGTPYFFHQVSGQVMEIRCAGRDRVMWDKDDLNTR